MKKLIALTLVGVMLFSTPIMAAEEDGDDAGWEEDAGGDEETDEGEDEGEDEGNKGSLSPSAPAISAKPKPKPEISPAPEAPVSVVEASSVPTHIAEAAAAEGKTVGEYMNNAVASVPGLDYVIPVGQGGHVIINGAPSNQVFSVLKPALANVHSAKAFASTLNGRVLNVVRINASISGFQTARVNFYMKGIRAGQNVKVFQKFGGQWLEINLVEVREDHVVVDMTALGTLAFIEMPN